MTGENEPLLEGTLISHLLELRTRLMRAFLAVILVFIPCALYSNQLFEWLSHPLLQQLPANSMLISTSITAPFTAPLKLAFFAALVVASSRRACTGTKRTSRCRCWSPPCSSSTSAWPSPTTRCFR